MHLPKIDFQGDMLVFRGVPATQEEQTSKQGHKSGFFSMFFFRYLTAFVASASCHMKHESSTTKVHHSITNIFRYLKWKVRNVMQAVLYGCYPWIQDLNMVVTRPLEGEVMLSLFLSHLFTMFSRYPLKEFNPIPLIHFLKTPFKGV